MQEQLKQEITKGISDAAQAAVVDLSKSVKGEVLAQVNDAIKEFAKTEELGVLRSKMVAMEDELTGYRKIAEANKSAGQELGYFEQISKSIVEQAKLARESNTEKEIDVPMFQKATGLTGSGLALGAPRPVDATFAYMRQPSGIRQAFTSQSVSSASIVIPTLIGTTTANGGYASQGISFGYNQAADQGDQTVVERTVNFKRYEGTNWIGEDVLADNGTLLDTFTQDLYAAAGQTVAVALCNGDGTGSGSAGNINGLFNGTAIPSGTSATINSSTGAVTIARVDFAGATLATALAGGSTVSNVGSNATYQKFVAAVYAIRPIYRNDLVWVLSSQALQQIRALVDAFGRPLFDESMVGNNPVAQGQPAYVGRFLGIPVFEEWYAPSFTATQRVRFGVLGSASRFFRIYDRTTATLTVTPITKLGYQTLYIRGRLNSLIWDVQAGVALEFTGAA